MSLQKCVRNQLTPKNAPKQVLSLIPLLKDYPNTHFGTFCIAIIRGDR
jgi:hypothetical protein